MGFWQGAALGNALAAGTARGRMIGEAKWRIRLQRELEDAEYDAATFKSYQELIRENKGPLLGNSIGFALFAKTRPDLLQKSATLNQRRAKNLELVAWSEYLIMIAYASSSMAEQSAPRLGHLSELINSGVFDNKDVSSVLRELASKAKAVSDAAYNTNPQEWFEARFNELKKIAKFKPNESLPTPESIRPTDPVLQNMTFDNVVDTDATGIKGLSV